MNSKTSPSGISHGSATTLLALVGALAMMAVPGQAQETGSITGLVLSQDDLAPIPGAVVALPDTRHRTRTDTDGWFRILNVPAGDILMRIEGEGFVTFVETVEIAPMEESLIHFHMHRLATVLDQLLVQVASPDDPARGHSEGRVAGSGNTHRTAADLIMMSVPGLNAASTQGGAGTGVRIRLRGVSSFVLSEEPHIYLDGVRIDAGGQDRAMLALADIPASSVARIRV
ncbi:MAG: carboxypeptidase regulatory-like domain-containing protein, partial [Thioalkalivibrio sp.]|nr:carboxypeptidase regulatory-like domain-containing protein [Thioalkalivibrio sp.]